MHRVVVILGVRRIDGDERNAAPVFAAGMRGRTRGVGFLDHGAGKCVRNIVGVDGDQADGALALERTKSRDDGARGKPEPAVPRYFDRHKVAIDRACGGVWRDAHFAAELFLVDRHQPAAAAGQAAKDSERATLGAIDQLDDAPGRLTVARPLDADQRAVAEAGDFARPRAARRGDMDDGRRTMGFLVPFGRPGEQFAVAVAASDVGQHDRRQGAGDGAGACGAGRPSLGRQFRAACG